MFMTLMRMRDLPAVLALEHICFPDPWDLEMLVSCISVPGAISLVCREGDVIIGYVLAIVVADEMHVTDLAVRPEHRRKGLGRALMNELFKRAEFGTRTTKAVLEVRRSNEKAQGLYRSMGFQVVGARRAYYRDGEDALTMVLDYVAPQE